MKAFHKKHPVIYYNYTQLQLNWHDIMRIRPQFNYYCEDRENPLCPLIPLSPCPYGFTICEAAEPSPKLSVMRSDIASACSRVALA